MPDVRKKISEKTALRLYVYMLLSGVYLSYSAAIKEDVIVLTISSVVALLGVIGLAHATLQKDVALPQFHLVLGGIAIGCILMNTFVYFYPPG